MNKKILLLLLIFAGCEKITTTDGKSHYISWFSDDKGFNDNNILFCELKALNQTLKEISHDIKLLREGRTK